MTEALQRYVLGDLSDAERAELEEKYFADDELFDQLVEVENDLVDAYVDGTLTPADRKKFEERFMTTSERRDRVAFARALRQRMKVRPRTRWWLAVAASFAILGFATAWLVFSPRPTEERAPMAVVKPVPPPPETLLTVVLTPGGTRDAGAAPPLVLRTAPQWVQLDLVLEQDRYESYIAEVQDVEGRVLWSEKSRKPKVPARLLPPGDYVVVLYGVKDGAPVEINNYTFNVTPASSRP